MKTRVLFALMNVGAFISIILISSNTIYNSTASMPYGFYRVYNQIYTPHKGDIVMVKITSQNDKLLKKVVALAGDRVKITNKKVYINNKAINNGSIYNCDTHGVPLKPYLVDKILEDDEIFIMGENDRSYDSRYFGPIKISQSLIFKAKPIYTWS